MWSTWLHHGNHLIDVYHNASCWGTTPLQWCHNEHDGISDHQPYDCLLNRLFRRRSKKTSKLRVTGLCAGNSPVTGEFPAQMASDAKIFPFDNVIMDICRLTIVSMMAADVLAPNRHQATSNHHETATSVTWFILHIDGLVQERRNSSVSAMELHLFCINPSTYAYHATAINKPSNVEESRLARGVDII